MTILGRINQFIPNWVVRYVPALLQSTREVESLYDTVITTYRFGFCWAQSRL